MIEVKNSNIMINGYHSSKGNQSKWIINNNWYKVDNNGYEGLSEYVISSLLGYSNLRENEYVKYELEEIKYNENLFLGCSSKNFLEDGESLITLERFYKNLTGGSLSEVLEGIYSVKERFNFLVETVESNTNIENFADYLGKMLIIDGLFLNEDRHLHNIAIIKKDGHYSLCPIFDNGAGLLSDYKNDYALCEPVDIMINRPKGKTISTSFDEQINAALDICNIDLVFHFGEKETDEILKKCSLYDTDILKRVKKIIICQMNKYNYFFE